MAQKEACRASPLFRAPPSSALTVVRLACSPANRCVPGVFSAVGRIEERSYLPYAGVITDREVDMYGHGEGTILKEAHTWPPGQWHRENGDAVDTEASWIEPGVCINMKLSNVGARACKKALAQFEARFNEGELTAKKGPIQALANVVAEVKYYAGWTKTGAGKEKTWPKIAWALRDLKEMTDLGQTMLSAFASHVFCEDRLGQALEILRSSISVDLNVANAANVPAIGHKGELILQWFKTLCEAFKGVMTVLRGSTVVLEDDLTQTWATFDSIVRWSIVDDDRGRTPAHIIRSHDVFPRQSATDRSVNVHGKPGQSPFELSICSFNMKNFGTDRSGIADYHAVLREIADHLKQYDVVVLQELQSPLVSGAFTPRSAR